MIIRFTLAASLLGLAACGSSGGGGGAPAAVPFSSFAEVADDGTVIINGQAVTAAFTANTPGVPTSGVTVTNVAGPNGATLAFFTQAGELVTAVVNAPGSSGTVDTRTGGVFAVIDGNIEGTSGDGLVEMVFADPDTQGFNYQTFGVWLNGDPTISGTFGTGSFGNPTPAVPALAMATYNGKVIGILGDSLANFTGVVTGDASITTDFVTVDFETTNSIFSSYDGTQVGINANALDLGALNLPITGTTFAGNVSSILTSGTVNGQFYGPNAEEAGGTFNTSGSRFTYTGSFGGRR